jgi:hypothetical protein
MSKIKIMILNNSGYVLQEFRYFNVENVFFIFQNISNNHSEVGLPIISPQDNRTR